MGARDPNGHPHSAVFQLCDLVVSMGLMFLA